MISIAQLFKRVFDVCVSLAVLVPAAPILGIAALSIRLEDGGPVFYLQARAGRGGRSFALLKFRSMRVDVPPPEAVGQVTAGHALVTRTGHWIRRLKIDELPQLWNVLRGEMSLVGPRPALLSDTERYDAVTRQRLSVPPGMTGWAQVNGNVQLTWPERIALDVWYVRHWSLGLDFLILARTVDVILCGERVSSNALRQATADLPTASHAS